MTIHRTSLYFPYNQFSVEYSTKYGFLFWDCSLFFFFFFSPMDLSNLRTALCITDSTADFIYRWVAKYIEICIVLFTWRLCIV